MVIKIAQFRICRRNFSLSLKFIGFIFPTSPSETKEIDLKVSLILLFTWVWWVEHFGITSRLCLAIRSKSWLTRKEGGKHTTPPMGMVINARHMGQRNCPVSRAKVATIRSRQWRQTVCEHGNNLGICSTASYIPVKLKRKYYRAEIRNGSRKKLRRGRDLILRHN